jgi:DNA helicase-2/ATP-dependent DNA helicase PcrA
MMLGNESQSIYAFNGSNNKYMSEMFLQDFKPTVYKLDNNFRSAKEIIEFSNTLTGNFEDLKKYYYNGMLSITEYEDEVMEAKAICETVQALMVNGHKDIENTLNYYNFAVIARNKYVFSQIENKFNEEKIPFFYKKIRSGIACETDFMEAFDLILRLLINPFDIYHMEILSNLVSKNEAIDSKYPNIITKIEQLLDNSKFAWLKKVLLHITADGNLNFDKVIMILKDNLPDNLHDDENYLLQNDIEEWKNHWLIFKEQTTRENRTLISFRNAISLGKTQKKEMETGVALLTAHMSKGLEFEVVFIIGLSEGTFPDYRAVRSGGEALEQEKNNMYVAVTRAKRLCYLSYPGIKMMPWGDYKQQKPSRYIKNYGISSYQNINSLHR